MPQNPGNTQSTSLPGAEDILSSDDFSEVDSNEIQESTQRKFLSESEKAEDEWIRLRALQDHYRHKTVWSWFILAIMAVMILFQYGLLICVGTGVLSFVDYDWLLPAFLAQNLGQIIALALVIVRSLFR